MAWVFNPFSGSFDNTSAFVSSDLNYLGLWNASTNSPAIPAASASNKNNYYIVSTAGSTSVSGISSWDVGDWIISNGASWQKLVGADAGINSVGAGLGLSGGVLSLGDGAGVTYDGTNKALTLTGATVTTSNPVLNLSQTWNAGAVTFTGLKFNATDTASASGSLLLDLQVGAASVFNVTKTGGFTFTDASTTTGSTSWNFYASNLTAPGSATLTIGKNTNARANVLWDSLATTAQLSAYNSGTTAHVTLLAGGTGGNLYLRPGSSGATQLGAADAAAPVAQTLQVQSVVAGTSNTAGTNFTINGSKGTGTGAGGDIIFQVAPAGTTGTAQNALATALRIYNTKTVSIGVAYLVSTLPAAGTAGRRAWVTDATAPTYLGTLTGGGSVVCPVFDNGTAWVSA